MANGEAKRVRRVSHILRCATVRTFVLALAASVPLLGGAEPGAPQPLGCELSGQVRSNELVRLLRILTGEEAVSTNGKPAFITTRHTTSGKPLRLALRFAAGQFAAAGLAVEFRGWSRDGYTNRNLIATQAGTVDSNEFIWFTAHLDVRNLDARAAGADDSASGCAAVLTAAKILSRFKFERSIRYALFTGEEQGGLGSAVEAEGARAAGENIAGVINADMIAWDKRPPPVLRLVTRTNSTGQFPQDLALAAVVTNAIHACGLGGELLPVITATGNEASDHASFWAEGFPAVLVTEDFQRDANPFYHTPKDTVARVNWKYFTATVRALVATVAELAGPVEPTPHR